MSDMNFTIDGIPVTVPRGTTILEAAKKVNVKIPILCDHPLLGRRAICRICVVEADGGSKLLAACANSGWEGANIVTNNKRLLMIRKTIVEMILASHPHDCLSCIRSKSCELQTLAEHYGIFATSFENDAQESQPVIENDTLVRNMARCVKCNRCVEVCQEIQTIGAINTSHRSHEYEISTAYKQSLDETPCVYCGGCAVVCPVGAIYRHDQTREVWAAINDTNIKTISQVSSDFLSAIEYEVNLTYKEAAGSITIGKVVSAIKLLGFDKVFDATIAANAVNADINDEIKARKNSGKLPVISSRYEGTFRFINSFYPDLAGNITTGKTRRKIFASLIKRVYAKEAGIDPINVISVSFVPGVALKFTTEKDKTDFALTAKELVLMIKLAGIKFESLPEEKFDAFKGTLPSSDITVKKETAYGYAQARKIMEAIRKGECEAEWVEIESRPKT